MGMKKPEPTFLVRLFGHGLKPEAVPLPSLARVLSAVQRLASEEDEDAQTADYSPVHLLDVLRSMSATYPFFAEDADRVIGNLQLTGKIIEHPDFLQKRPMVLSPVEDLSAIAKALNCTIEFRLPGRTGDILATILPATYATISEVAFIKGETTIMGVVERVGGATEQRCGLRLEDQPRKMLICTVEDTEVARKLGQHLYQRVILNGVATWYRHTWRISHFVIRSMAKPKNGSIADTMKRLRLAGGDVWDQFDNPHDHLLDIRGE